MSLIKAGPREYQEPGTTEQSLLSIKKSNYYNNMKKILFYTMLVLAISACKKSDSSDSNAFAGTWTGAFTGNDNGTWTVSINNNGTVSGSGRSTVANSTFTISGRVNNAGSLMATFGTSSLDGTFNGTMTGRNATGTWSNGTYQGPWSGTKQ